MEILNTLHKKEQLLSDLKLRPKENAKDINRLMLSLRTDYQNFILEHPLESFQHDSHATLWKNCFYKQIEEYRKSIKRTKAMIGDVNNTNDSKIADKAIVHLSNLVTAFNKYLTDAVTWYQELLLKVENKAFKTKKANVPTHFVYSISRCLLYLGDLTRYRTLHSEEDSADYQESVKYYERAAYVYPQSGHPFNQLALIASYNDAPFDAMFYHYRSILCQDKFPSGVSNLVNLFEKYTFATDANLTNIIVGKLNKLSIPKSASDKRKRENEVNIHILLYQIIELHRELFEWNQKITKYIIGINNSTTAAAESNSIGGSGKVPTPPPPPPLNTMQFLNLFHEKMQEMLSTLDELLKIDILDEDILVRIVSVSIFAIEFQTQIFDNIGGLTGSEGKKYRSIGDSLSLCLAFNLIHRISALSCRLLNTPTSDKAKRVHMYQYIPPLSLFSDFFMHSNSTALSLFDPPLPPSSPTNAIPIAFYSVLSSPAVLDLENKARVTMQRSINVLSDFINGLKDKQSNKISSSANARTDLYMKEDLELIGLLSMMAHHQQLSDTSKLLYFPLDILSEEESRYRRLVQIHEFVHHLSTLTLSPAPPAAIPANVAMSSSVPESTEGNSSSIKKRGGLIPSSFVKSSSVEKSQKPKDRRERKNNTSTANKSHRDDSIRRNKNKLDKSELLEYSRDLHSLPSTVLETFESDTRDLQASVESLMNNLSASETAEVDYDSTRKRQIQPLEKVISDVEESESSDDDGEEDIDDDLGDDDVILFQSESLPEELSFPVGGGYPNLSDMLAAGLNQSLGIDLSLENDINKLIGMETNEWSQQPFARTSSQSKLSSWTQVEDQPAVYVPQTTNTNWNDNNYWYSGLTSNTSIMPELNIAAVMPPPGLSKPVSSSNLSYSLGSDAAYTGTSNLGYTR